MKTTKQIAAVKQLANRLKQDLVDRGRYEVKQEGSIIHSVIKRSAGFSCEIRVYGEVEIGGTRYELDRVIIAAMKKRKATKERTEKQ